MARRYQPPREYVESHEFQQDFDALAGKYPGLIEVVGALLWGIGENPLDFDSVPGHQAEGIRVAKSPPVIIKPGDTEVFVLRVFFTVPKSGAIELELLDVEAGDSAETGS